MKDILNTDAPIEGEENDKFLRYPFSKRMAKIISAHKGSKSLIMGLYGKWGEGKTTVLNFVKKELTGKTIVINFNPWHFSDEKQLMISFFGEIATALNQSKKTGKERIGEFLDEYAWALGTITRTSKENIKEMGSKLKATSIEKTKERIDNLIVESKKQITVFIDDIDRLDANEIQYVFKLVKLVADFPNTVYVLAFDDEMVSNALAPMYGGKNNKAGHQFLEKIIQIPIKIPKASQMALRSYTLDLINKSLSSHGVQLADEDQATLIENFDLAFLPIMDNPRMGVRLANTIAFSVPLLMEEVNIGDLMIIEGFKIFYPPLYDFIRNSPALFAQYSPSERTMEDSVKKSIKEDINSILKLYNAKTQKTIIELLENLFPQLEAVFHNVNYTDASYQKWFREKRISSGKHFERYFSYSVEEADIPDSFFSAFLESLKAGDESDTINRLTALFKDFEVSEFIFRLRIWEAELDAMQSKTLSLALSKIGHTFSQEDHLRVYTTFSQSANLIARLIRNLEKPDQFPFILQILKACVELEYAMEIEYWLMYRDINHPEKAILSGSQRTQMHESLITEFRSKLNDNNLLTILPDTESPRLLKWWAKSNKQKDGLLTYISDKFNSDKDFPLRFIKTFIPTGVSYGKDSEQIFKGGFLKPVYDSIKSVVDVHELHKWMVKRHGMVEIEKNPNEIPDREPLNDDKILAIFYWMYNTYDKEDKKI